MRQWLAAGQFALKANSTEYTCRYVWTSGAGSHSADLEARAAALVLELSSSIVASPPCVLCIVTGVILPLPHNHPYHVDLVACFDLGAAWLLSHTCCFLTVHTYLFLGDRTTLSCFLTPFGPARPRSSVAAILPTCVSR